MSEPRVLTGTFIELVAEGTTFRVPLIKTMRQMNAITSRCEGKKDFEYLDEFQQFIQDDGGPLLTLDQAEELWQFLEAEYVKKKESHVQLIKTIAESQPSTT